MESHSGRGISPKNRVAEIVLTGQDFCWAILFAMVTASGLLLACALGTALSFTAYIAALALCARVDTLSRWAATAVALAGLCTAIFHLLAWQHAFTRIPVLAAALAASGRCSGWNRRVCGGFRVPSSRSAIRQACQRPAQGEARIDGLRSLSCLGPLPAVARAIVLPPLGWDALTYHSVKAAMWVQHGGGR
jgi:hypothetical protein